MGLRSALAVQDESVPKRALFLEHRDEVFLDRLAVGQGIVKIKGRVPPCQVRSPLVPIAKGAVADDFQLEYTCICVGIPARSPLSDLGYRVGRLNPGAEMRLTVIMTIPIGTP